MAQHKRYIGDGFKFVGVKIPKELDDKIEAIAFWSRKKKWQIIAELLREALKDKKIKPIPPDARE